MNNKSVQFVRTPCMQARCLIPSGDLNGSQSCMYQAAHGVDIGLFDTCNWIEYVHLQRKISLLIKYSTLNINIKSASFSKATSLGTSFKALCVYLTWVACYVDRHDHANIETSRWDMTFYKIHWPCCPTSVSNTYLTLHNFMIRVFVPLWMLIILYI